MEFKEFNLHPQVAAGVTAAGYTTPTPIQAQAIPTVMEGRDVMGLAQTGTGKTAAFALPILHRLAQGERGRVRALIIAPTRELAEQINDSFVTLGRQTRLRSVTVYGGVNVNPQIQKLKAGAEIVVACPGRLLDHMAQGTIDLSHLEVLVLDEADQMFDMGFLPDLRRILKQLPPKRQTLLFSATMPIDIRVLAQEILREPVTVQVGNVAPPVTVTHALYPVEQHLKTPLLLELLRHTDTESVLIFTRTKHRAKRLGEQLEKAGYKAASLQGNLSQNRRQAALDGFRDGTFQILVATDIAARGIDVSQVSHVINYDIPDTAEAYIHRIGRTGRAARSGDAFTMVTSEDGAMVRTIERKLNTSLERRTMAGFDYSVPAPKKDTEFARPPRQPMPSRRPAEAKKGGARQGASQQPGSAKPAEGRRPQQQGAKLHPARTAGAGGQRSSQQRRQPR
ncbi:DEAD/DEAH box helicase [Geobacter hydrogenophilus]|uniref:DEAD-box ATP-dependent RNA helicase RhpA n=1 Tax=Geobacter hydrogenophilus TaxID=40983 RepID=A0A9W6LEV2_9BACT|nr:DEAD/DEAH box helicase [Geobacter hydrogenophilus]MBT0892505.1 DEAD/DEAH box helicase [Geobacter hydrogenophilus]GLI39901.1 ATP-dependent RNA helicase RhlE [Geobacter hydrogenophilus]